MCVLFQRVEKLLVGRGYNRTLSLNGCFAKATRQAIKFCVILSEALAESKNPYRFYVRETDCHGFRPRNDTKTERTHCVLQCVLVIYLVPKIRSPASPRPGTM